ncbi:SLAM family member 5 [Xenopus laevis]|uniref:SLAM family member 5 n=2 Tax=Xenopus laevis TaxID=8355 RepID=A0A1L8FCE1_XENLA|nr:SLAM family member 5 [Xenopus laevis]OCT69251.1 hypothetical protein XELAEV_18040562mg [Xenopus laevis]
MNCFFYCQVIIFAAYKGVWSEVNCIDIKMVEVAAGEELTLQLDRPGIKETSWIYKGRHIATTKPNAAIEVKNRKLTTRLSSKPDGSLIMQHLISDDQGVYTADMYGKEEKDDFTQCYDVRVHKKISLADVEIHQSVTRNGTCTVTLMCTVNVPDVTPFWINTSAEDFDVTGNIVFVYKSHPNATFSCMAQNAVSNVSRTETPWRYCQEVESEIQRITAEKSSSLVLLLIVPVAVLLILFVIYWRKKNMKSPWGTKEKAAHVTEPAVVVNTVNTVNTVNNVVRKEGNEETTEDRHQNKDAQISIYSIVLPKV